MGGEGTLSVGQYSGDPVGVAIEGGVGAYFDAELSSGNTFSSMTLTDCSLEGGNLLEWWNPATDGGSGAWEAVSPTPTFSDGPPPCLSVTLSPTSSPSLSELTGSVFGVATAAGPSAPTTPAVTSISPGSGPTTGGTTVTVAGIGFEGVTGVDFGSAPAEGYTVVSPTSLTAQAPPGSGTVDVQVVTSTGTSAITSADQYTYLAPTPSGNGYFEVTSGGDVYTFGDAQFAGSTGDIHLAQPIVGIVAVSGGGGYWLVARDGGVFSFGDAKFYGSLPGLPASEQPGEPVVAMGPS